MIETKSETVTEVGAIGQVLEIMLKQLDILEALCTQPATWTVEVPDTTSQEGKPNER